MNIFDDSRCLARIKYDKGNKVAYFIREHDHDPSNVESD